MADLKTIASSLGIDLGKLMKALMYAALVLSGFVLCMVMKGQVSSLCVQCDGKIFDIAFYHSELEVAKSNEAGARLDQRFAEVDAERNVIIFGVVCDAMKQYWPNVAKGERFLIKERIKERGIECWLE